MSSRTRNEKYKGFNIEYFIVPKGFNEYTVTITKYRNKGTRREEYYLEKIKTNTSSLSGARIIARRYINNIGKLKWSSQGLQGAKYLPA